MLAGTQLLLIAVFGVIGLVAGALIALLIANRSSNSEKSSIPQPTVELPLPAGRAGEVRLRLSEADQTLVVAVGDATCQDVDSLSADELERMTDLYRAWGDWLHIQPEAPQLAGGEPREEDAYYYPTAAVAEPVPPKTGDKKAAAAVKAGSSSIVQQIDEILQDMLEESPLQSKGIKLVDDIRHGVVVWIGLEHFEGIDAVTDQEARELIQAAAAEWERRTGDPR